MKKTLFILLILGSFSCTNQVANNPGTSPSPSNPASSSSPSSQIPNPASQNCIQKGGKLEMRTNTAGQYGVCIFNDGSECEEWEFYRGTCQIGQKKS